MKLVDILARELKEWPEGAVSCVQDRDREVRFYGSSCDEDFFATALAEKDDEVCLPGGIPYAGKVTSAQWQAAVDALKAEKEKAMSIDWSNAPDWADALGEVTCITTRSIWFNDTVYMYVGDSRSYQWMDSSPGLIHNHGRKSVTNIRLRPAPWVGEGMPPIGSHVVVVDDGSLIYGQGESGEVLAHVDGTAVIRMSYGLGCFLPRYLRTKDQVEAELLKSAIDDMVNVGSCGSGVTIAQVRIVAERLAKAGYRKFEIVDKDDGEEV